MDWIGCKSWTSRLDWIHIRWWIGLVLEQWRRLHRAREARAPTFTNGWARGAPWVEEQQTRNWPNCILTITKALTETTNRTFRAKKTGGARPKNFFPALCPGSVPPTFAPDRCPPLSNSFRRHCSRKYPSSTLMQVSYVIRTPVKDKCLLLCKNCIIMYMPR